MNPDATAALLRTLAEIPARLAALERQQAELARQVEATRRALPPRLLTTRQAAEVIGVSEGTVRRWVKSGSIPSLKIEGTTRIDLTFYGSHEMNEHARKARPGPTPVEGFRAQGRTRHDSADAE